MPIAHTVPSNIPQVRFHNLLDTDPLAEAFWPHLLGKEQWEAVRGHFAAMGEAGAQATPLSALADQQGPRLVTHNASGERVDEIVYHPAYRELEALAYGGGIVAAKYDPEFPGSQRSIRHQVGFGAGYYFAQSDIGLYCPICMTDGVGRVLERHPDLPAAAEALAHIASRDPARLWRGAMFITEKQGGSDVGANAVTAREDGGTWRLTGDKWFCSNVDAEAILALARMPGGPPGTRGLGLFLVLRDDPAGNGRTIRIHRIKEKMGVRCVPTGEVTLEDTAGYLLAGIGEGFKEMAEMINLSRLYSAVASLAGMRRGLLEALAHGSERMAFGKRLWEQPLWRASLADLMAEHLAATVLVFETARALDRADTGDESEGGLARLLTPIAKALTGKQGVFTVSETMEAIGGNAYIEESILPRLLRDTQVLPIWEGATNILTLDVLRALERERAHEAFFARVNEGLAAAASAPTAIPARAVTQARAHLRLVQESLAELQTLDADSRQRAGRQWMEAAGRAFSMALLLEAATSEGLTAPCLAAFNRVSARPSGTAPLAGSDAVLLADTEEVLLRAGYAPGKEI